ncbi:MAG TPA: hypothetical protein VGI95_05835 [Caulobacteraceae bacterium]
MATSIASDRAAEMLAAALSAHRDALAQLQRRRRNLASLINKAIGASAVEGALAAAGVAPHLAIHVSAPRRRSFETQARSLIGPAHQPPEEAQP